MSNHALLAQMMRTQPQGTGYGDDFVILFEPGATTYEFTFPLNSAGGDSVGQIDWGDGSTSQISSYDDPNRIHTYNGAVDAQYEIRISGSMGSFVFQNSGDNNRVKRLLNLGTVFNRFTRAFETCSTMIFDPGATGVIRGAADYMFKSCSVLGTIPTTIEYDPGITTFHSFAMAVNFDAGAAPYIAPAASATCVYMLNGSTLRDFSNIDLTHANNLTYAFSGHKGGTIENFTKPPTGSCTWNLAFSYSYTLNNFPPNVFDNCPDTQDFPSIFGACGLTLESVTNILQSFVASGLYNKNASVNGGTNAPPTGDALTALEILTNDRGWTITTN